MSHLFAPPPLPMARIRGSDQLYPIRRIFCVGRNYEAHAREMGAAADRDAPFYFTKSAFHHLPSGATLAYPPGSSNVHHEMELVVALGAPAFHITSAAASACIFGYACGLDMTRRDLQQAARDKGRPWDTGKDFEGSAVLADIVPVADCGYLEGGAIELKVNGIVRQAADIGSLIHPVAAVIADLSRYYHLDAGDLIYTGTPAGVGPVQRGDQLCGSIQRLGEIRLSIQ